MVIHAALLDAERVHADDEAVTVTDCIPPSAPIAALVGETVNVQPFA
jgi:hypothetical protein